MSDGCSKLAVSLRLQATLSPNYTAGWGQIKEETGPGTLPISCLSRSRNPIKTLSAQIIRAARCGKRQGLGSTATRLVLVELVAGDYVDSRGRL